jgi:hypothetical protein
VHDVAVDEQVEVDAARAETHRRRHLAEPRLERAQFRVQRD